MTPRFHHVALIGKYQPTVPGTTACRASACCGGSAPRRSCAGPVPTPGSADDREIRIFPLKIAQAAELARTLRLRAEIGADEVRVHQRAPDGSLRNTQLQPAGPQLFNLDTDIGESKNVAAEHPGADEGDFDGLSHQTCQLHSGFYFSSLRWDPGWMGWSHGWYGLLELLGFRGPRCITVCALDTGKCTMRVKCS